MTVGAGLGVSLIIANIDRVRPNRRHAQVEIQFPRVQIKLAVGIALAVPQAGLENRAARQTDVIPVWVGNVQRLGLMHNILNIDCATSTVVDPTPNIASEVRSAMKGKGIITKVRVGSELEEILPQVEALADPDLKLVIELAYSEENAERNYKTVKDKLLELYP